MGAAQRQAAADRLHPAGQRAGLFRAGAEGGAGRHPAARRSLSTVLARRGPGRRGRPHACRLPARSEEHTSELQSLRHLVCRLLLEKKKKKNNILYNLNKKKTYSHKTI